jgi:hypothetical protein
MPPVRYGRDGYVVPVGEDPADPHDRRELVLRDADGPPHEVRRFLDPAVGVDVDAVVPERP